jgi:hypothetical protein
MDLNISLTNVREVLNLCDLHYELYQDKEMYNELLDYVYTSYNIIFRKKENYLN